MSKELTNWISVEDQIPDTIQPLKIKITPKDQPPREEIATYSQGCWIPFQAPYAIINQDEVTHWDWLNTSEPAEGRVPKIDECLVRVREVNQ